VHDALNPLSGWAKTKNLAEPMIEKGISYNRYAKVIYQLHPAITAYTEVGSLGRDYR
jgi:hypothetical protein